MAGLSEGQEPGRALPAVPRQIREPAFYAQQFDEIGLDAEALDERLEPILWEISRIPELFTRIRGTELSVVDHEGDPPLRIYFTYGDEFVELLGIERRDT